MKTRDKANQLLKNARKKKGINQKELAKLANTNYQEISAIENGKQIKPENFAKICEILDIDILSLYIDVDKLTIALNQLPENKKTEYILEVMRRILCR